MAEALPSQISCLLIPVRDKNLLLPNASVAEVIAYQHPEATQNTPAWFLGFIQWRGLRLPLISYEAANGSENHEITATARIAVTNTIGEHQPPLSFMALVASGIPRLVKVTKAEITETHGEAGPADKAMVNISGEEAVIPELVQLEKLAVEALSYF